MLQRLYNDNELFTKTVSIGLIAKEAKYHHTCRRAYIHKAEKEQFEPLPSERTVMHASSFENLKSYIEETFILNEGAELLKT